MKRYQRHYILLSIYFTRYFYTRWENIFFYNLRRIYRVIKNDEISLRKEKLRKSTTNINHFWTEIYFDSFCDFEKKNKKAKLYRDNHSFRTSKNIWNVCILIAIHNERKWNGKFIEIWDTWLVAIWDNLTLLPHLKIDR